MDAIQRELLVQVADLHEIPVGAYNIRANGSSVDRKSTGNIEIINKEDKSGIEIHIKPGTKRESVHIPVIMSQSGLEEVVYNDFYIGENADVTIIAGCGIHNGGDASTRHDGIHRFFIEKNAHVKYIEKHYGSGDGKGERIMNPVTEIHMDEDSFMEMDTVQIKGVDSTKRENKAWLKEGAKLIVMERLMTHGRQRAESYFDVQLDGEDSSANIISRSVARNDSFQLFQADLCGNNRCSGHTECDAIIMENAKISAVPELTANHVDAALIHEAAIGKIAGEQLIKLMTLGLTEAEAEEQIISGFLK
ncbi:SufB/SufD family protein [Blautia sp.]|jgi:Fe-S cluster assembly scaffold protein SufB|uniref:SufB/SufD family protein n=1 Tax=Blautia sp. TaxID=1955243 RepID=UPI00280C17E2|nr:SufD family Fe-S cluster assembly protein [Blautia sp.]MDY3017986.1 SufD family Fe-S cluster assembly protein [Blautia sp.]